MAASQPTPFGNYLLGAHLGRGGMADVFRARRIGAAGFERTVVVKKILASHQDEPKFVEMFVNEAKLAARLTHPNIVQVFELGEVGNELFMAMEYVRGKDLLHLLQRLEERSPQRSMLSPLAAAYIAREVCRGLAHAHEHTDENGAPRPIIHRDVSPQNVMISYDGQVKLVDFGIAKALAAIKESTRSDALRGKHAYMSPEQIQGQPIGPEADVFATGVVLHEMLTGKRLFKGATEYHTLNNVMTMQVPPPSSVVPEVAPELDAVVLRALDRDLAQRCSRAATMARDLDLYLATRFAAEDMAELMKGLFPSAAKGEKTEDSISGSSDASMSYSARRAIQAAAAAHPVPSRWRGAWLTLGVLLAMGAGMVLVASLLRRQAPAPPVIEAPAAVVQPAPAPAPPQEVQVMVQSEPSGAQISDGPKLLGITPQAVRLPAGSPGIPLTLTLPGHAELRYILSPGDAPSITLRLAATPPLPKVRRAKEAPGRAPKVEVFDEPAAAPKVQPIED